MATSIQDSIAAVAGLLGGFRVTQMLYVAAELRLADVLASGPRHVDRIADAVDAQPDALRRLLRALASHGVFAEPEPSVFASTPLADVLRANAPGSLRALAISYGQPWWWRSFGHLLHTVRTGAVAFDHEHGEPFFDFLQHDAEAAAIFHANMAAMTKAESAAIAETCAFDGVGSFVDVGGGDGTLTSAILARWPHTRGLVFDRPSSAATAAPAPAPGHSRFARVAGDFFVDRPPTADRYLLKDILHDWDDDRAVTVLSHCRAVMTDEARVLVIERLMPSTAPPAEVTHVDVTMLVLTGGRERTVHEYAELLRRAGLRLVLTRPVNGPLAILEAQRA